MNAELRNLVSEAIKRRVTEYVNERLADRGVQGRICAKIFEEVNLRSSRKPGTDSKLQDFLEDIRSLSANLEYSGKMFRAKTSASGKTLALLRAGSHWFNGINVDRVLTESL